MSGGNLTWEQLQAIADQEISRIIRDLPSDLATKARSLPLILEPRPNAGWIEDGIEPDSLGLFVGAAYPDETHSLADLPAQIILFLENIWEMVEKDETEYREEIRRTYMHELGHFLGLDEDDLWDRDLD